MEKVVFIHLMGMNLMENILYVHLQHKEDLMKDQQGDYVDIFTIIVLKIVN